LDDLERDDAELVRAFQAGDADAFATLVERYRRPLWRVAWGILRNAEQADEATQDAFVKAWHGLSSFKGESTFKTWVYRITMNAAFDLRQREQAQGRARARAEHEALAATPGRGPRVLRALIEDEQAEQVRQAMALLPERQRLTLTLRLRDGLKYAEIAEALETSVGTVKANIHHAVRNLRKALGEMGATTGEAPELTLGGDAAASEG
jgi:RNA polymerase sigma-70 factor (ECF subfamily)